MKKIGGWDFSRLPKEEYKKVKAFIAQSNGRELAIIHGRYRLSKHVYCCPDDFPAALRYFEIANEKEYFND